MDQRPLVMALLAALGVLFTLQLQGAQAQSCGGVSGYNVGSGEPGTLVTRWNADPSFSRFTITARPTSDTTGDAVTTMEVPQGGVSVSITGLMNFTRYNVSVTPSCRNGGTGMIMSEIEVTSRTVPSGITTMVKIDPDNLPVLNISWTPIPEHQWNDVPIGYIVYLYRLPDNRVDRSFQVPYPDTHLVVFLADGNYGFGVVAVNGVGLSPNVFNSEPVMVGSPADRASFVNYPYFYILIPGVVFLAIIVGIIVVIFKKLHGRNKGSITFARGIDNMSPNYSSKGFGNAMPMRELSPNSPNISASVPASSAVASPSFMHQHNHHQQLANRPLPLSPDPALTPADDVFVVPVSAQSSISRKMTLPGPLPMLNENVEHAAFVPMSRTMTEPSLGSVFSPVSTASPIQLQQQQHLQQQHVQQQHLQQQQQHAQRVQQHHQHHQQRGRANTLPSPYEVPDQNTPQEMHSNGANYLNSSTGPRPNRGAGGSNIPPPPMHSPPPLTNELAQSFDSRHNQHQQTHHHHASGMNSLPRSMAGQRSFSTSTAQGRSIGPKGVSHMKSDGNIHDPMEGAPYYLPPVDSDEDPSIVSTSSHGAGSESAAARGRRPPYSYNHKQRQQARNPGMINGALASSDQLGNFGAGAGEGPIPPSHQLPPSRDRKRESLFSETSTELSIDGDHTHDDKNKRESLYSESSGEISPSNHVNPTIPEAGPTRERSRNESVFSETSTELSGSSNNSKRHSPGWGGVKSDVGVSHRRQRSKSPPERETFSDVIVHPPQSQNGFV